MWSTLWAGGLSTLFYVLLGTLLFLALAIPLLWVYSSGERDVEGQPTHRTTAAVAAITYQPGSSRAPVQLPIVHVTIDGHDVSFRTTDYRIQPGYRMELEYRIG